MKGQFSILLLLLLTLSVQAEVLPDDLPIAPEEAAVVQRLLEREQEDVVGKKAKVPGIVTSLLNQWADASIDLETLDAWQIHRANSDRHGFVVTYTPEGHIVAITGNGPWIQNETLRDFVNLPELRIIRVDHNSRHHQEPERGPLYRGEGFDALSDSKVTAVGLTSGINDDGLAAVKNLKNLKYFEIFHTAISEEGVIEHLSNQPTIKHLRLGQMAKFPASILSVVATMPNIEEVRFQEAYVTYDNGLDHLKPLAGQLKLIDLRQSLITEADLARLKADHPEAMIESSTPEEVGKGHKGVANRLSRMELPPELGEPLRAAMGNQ